MWSNMKSIVKMMLADFFFQKRVALYRQKGVTLIEMMVTISIMGIILAISWPSLQDFVNSNRRAAVMNELTAAFHHAKSEAIKRNANVTICRSANGASCGGQWENGWIVFFDADASGSVDAGDTLIERRGALDNGVTLRGNAFVADHITINSRGHALGHAGTLTLTDSAGRTSARIISSSGRIRR